jgi:hypothetical protein
MNQIVLEHGPATHREATDERERGRALRSRSRGTPTPSGTPRRAATTPSRCCSATTSPDHADLVPIRHGRMAADPFAFYRGSAAIMAADLATTPRSGLATQLCGDAHLSNFGVFASPERQLLFDLNDFDETLPDPGSGT